MLCVHIQSDTFSSPVLIIRTLEDGTGTEVLIYNSYALSLTDTYGENPDGKYIILSLILYFRILLPERCMLVQWLWI